MLYIHLFLTAGVPADEATRIVLSRQEKFYDLLERLTNGMSSPAERWLAFGCVILLSFVLACFINHLTRKILRKMAAATVNTIDDHLIEAMPLPLLSGLTATGIYLGTALLHPPEQTAIHLHRLYLGIMIALVIWLLMRSVRLISGGFKLIAEKTCNTYNTLLIALLTPVLQTVILVTGLLLILDHVFRFNITALLAGAGIAAMAVAFAAQNTIADIFGAVALITDRPFQLGQFITVGDKSGIVESIGLRSTRIRSLDGPQWSIPNRTMTDTAILNISQRPSFRHVITIGLTYGTPPEGLLQAKAILHEILDGHPLFDMKKKPPLIYFDQLADFSLNLRVYCWFQTTDWQRFMQAKDEINHQIFARLTAAGLNFAFPSQSLYIEQLPEK